MKSRILAFIISSVLGAGLSLFAGSALAIGGTYGSVNLAKGKVVTPLTNTVSGSPANVVDGRLDTVWYSYQGSPTSFAFVVDLGSAYSIGRIDTYILQTYGYAISTSLDNVNWTPRFMNAWTAPNTSVGAQVSDTANGAFMARYVKYESYANWPQYVGAVEIEIYEWLTSSPMPPKGAVGTTDLARNMPVENLLGSIGAFPPANAIDGSPSPWLSEYYGTYQGNIGNRYAMYGYIRIDLGAEYPIGKIVVNPNSTQWYYVGMSKTPDASSIENWVFRSYPSLFGGNSTVSDPADFMVNGATTARYIWILTSIVSADSFIRTGMNEVQVYEWVTAVVPKTLEENLAAAGDAINALTPPQALGQAQKSMMLGLLRIVVNYQGTTFRSLALAALNALILRTDGCALRGTPDTVFNQGGTGVDFIGNCAEQGPLYNYLQDAQRQLTAPLR